MSDDTEKLNESPLEMTAQFHLTIPIHFVSEILFFVVAKRGLSGRTVGLCSNSYTGIH